jgi:hypothetical protein
MFSIEIKDFVGMCLAFDHGGLIIGLQAWQLIFRRQMVYRKMTAAS